MNILLLNTNLETGGAERQLVQLVRYWPQGATLSVILLEQEGVWLSEIPSSVAVSALTEQMPKGSLPKIFWALRLVPRIRRWLLENPCDIVLTFLWLPTVLVALALRRLPNPPLLVWSVQNDLAQEFSLHWDGWLRSWLVHTILAKQVAHFVCISEGIRRKMQAFLGVSGDQFTVIPNGVDLDRVQKMAEIQESVPPKQASVRLVSVGRLHYAKGMDILLHTLAEVSFQNNDWECYILGEGPERLRLIQLADTLGLNERLFFVGSTPNPYAWLRTADIFVSASRWESFGVILTEAMALSLPIVATATDGARDILADGVEGLLVPVGDVSALAKAISDLIRDPSLRRKLGENAREKVQQFDAPLIAQRYAELLTNLLRKQRRY